MGIQYSFFEGILFPVFIWEQGNDAKDGSYYNFYNMVNDEYK